MNVAQQTNAQQLKHAKEQDSGPQYFSKTLTESCKGGYFVIISKFVKQVNPLSFNPTKWSNTLKQIVGKNQYAKIYQKKNQQRLVRQNNFLLTQIKIIAKVDH